VNTNSRPVGSVFGNPFRVAISYSLITQGSRATRVNPGLEVVNAFGVHVRDAQPAWMTQYVITLEYAGYFHSVRFADDTLTKSCPLLPPLTIPAQPLVLCGIISTDYPSTRANQR
jgi:hypothetical protein